jgi:prolyl-tRNA editing enzyme YbaK/EbsC (Cys-tRNA(Pro) deacylase)
MFPNAKTFSASTRTAEEAAEQIGCALGAICKSLIFRHGDDVILIITSGANRVDTEKVGAALGVSLEKADADFVRRKTGFAIGGVPPWGYERPRYVAVDADLQKYPEIWAAAGTPNSVFPTTFAELVEKTGALVVEV